MVKVGAKPKGKVQIKWSPQFAYAIGLIASDGCLSSDGRHITLVSKDIDQICNFIRALRIFTRISQHHSGSGNKAHRVQIGDINFYQFLESIGLTKSKSLTMGEIDIPLDYFFHYLRGFFDGDGCTYSYFDPRWKSSFMFYLGFVCASLVHITWLRDSIYALTGCYGHMTAAKKINTYYQLKFAKSESLIILKLMYKNKRSFYLNRKYLKINQALAIVGRSI